MKKQDKKSACKISGENPRDPIRTPQYLGIGLIVHRYIHDQATPKPNHLLLDQSIWTGIKGAWLELSHLFSIDSVDGIQSCLITMGWSVLSNEVVLGTE